MRVHDYHCKECKKTEERYVKDDKPQTCDCGRPMTKQISAPRAITGLSTPGRSI